MKEITNFAGQNWLITPAALAVGETPPQNISGQKFLLVLSGVGIADFKGNSTSQWLHETFRVFPDLQGPLKYAVNKYHIPLPATEALNFQLEQWSPFAAMSSIFNQNVSNNSGFAVDAWRPNPFGSGTDAVTNQPVGNLFNGVLVDVAVRDTDAIMHRLSYNFTLLGRIVSTRIIIT
jgi:hypothetical protein